MKRLEIAAAALIAIAVVIVYHRALFAYFAADDFQWLVTKSTFHWQEIVWPIGLSRFFRPVIEAYFSVATPLFDGSPLLFHAANIVLHVANGLLVLVLVRIASGRLLLALVAALLFVVQPGDTEGITWVGGLIEAVATCFGCLTLIAWLLYRRTGSLPWRIGSVVAFALALLTHESAVMFLPLLLAADWAFVDDFRIDGTAARRYLPFALLTAAYLLADFLVNRTHVVVQQGTYAIGWHGLPHALDYLVDLVVGRKNLVNYLLISATLAVCLASRRPRVRFAVAWLLLTLLPFVFFTWGNASRYLYLPAVGFSLLLAEGIVSLSDLTQRRLGLAAGRVVVILLTGVIAVRFALFARTNVDHFVAYTEIYRQYAAVFDEIHGADVRPYAVIVEDPRLNRQVEPQFAEALVQWRYGDATIRLAPRR